MNIRKLLIASAALMAFALPAQAAQQMMCTPDVAGGVQGPRRVVNTSSTASPQPVYQLNGQGCALIAQADVGFFQAQGFTQGSSELTVMFTTGVAAGTTDFVIGNVPPGYYIAELVFSNAVAAAVTGGIDMGTTANGVDVVSAQAVGSAALTFTANAAILKQVFSTTVTTPIHAAAHTAWNSTNVTITMKMAAF